MVEALLKDRFLPVLSPVSADAAGLHYNVNADDAASALAIGMLNGTSLDEMNAWATRAAAFVCSQAGGTPRFPSELRFRQ